MLLNKWLREPLLHFLLIGAALFLFYSLQNDPVDNDRNRIVVTEAEIDRLISLWEKQRQRLPARFELEGLIEAQIREQVLYREALAMGLDQDDIIVRRRMAQKVEFIFSDIASLVEPTEADLAEYLVVHADKFEIPGRVSYRQVYLNVDDRGEQVQEDATRLLVELQKAEPDADISTAGDRFMFGQDYDRQSPREVSRIFGEVFAEQLFELPVGDWTGPVQSGYGLHLVQINDKTASRQPELTEVRDKVHTEWLAQQRRDGDEAFYQSLRQRYEIIIENSDTNDSPAGDGTASANQ